MARAIAVLLFVAAPVGAQPAQPVGGFVIDAHAAFASLPQSDAIATPRLTTAANLPTRALGLEVGAHVLPLRWKGVTFGFGASFLMARGSKTLEPAAGSTEPAPPGVRADFTAIAPQVSMNFGRREGWSYISGGVGLARYRAWREDLTREQGDNTRALNYGGGARWFTSRHIAFSFDIRFHALGSSPQTQTGGGHPAMTRVVISAGVSFR